MRWSQSCIPTLKEEPREAEIASHKLMLRAGLIKKLTSGIYTFLPLGFKVLKNIEQIVREEMNCIGCQEMLMPILHPSEIYRESGRFETFGPELFKIYDSRKRLFALGPTHEEVITMIARDDLKSYRDLPQCLYQILTKFRDEIRPRYGVIRAREFIMKDAYSFHEDEQSLHQTYVKMEQAYSTIIQRCGLEFRAVEAESGYIGGSVSHEFMVLADNGEDQVLTCECGYGVNLEKATAEQGDRVVEFQSSGEGDYREVETPGMTTVEEVASYLETEEEKLIKTMLYRTGDKTVAVLIPGDRNVNDIKLVKVFDDPDIRFLEPAEILEITGGPAGFSGPVGLPDEVEIYADNLIRNHRTAIAGGNRKDIHLAGVRVGTDFEVGEYHDFVMAREGDLCPRCGKGMELKRGVEVGHIFKLGTRYSEAMSATFLDNQGKARPFVMGCYGFGISRMIAAAVEQNNDSKGIIWPPSISPMDVHILPVNMSDEKVVEETDRLEQVLSENGIEILVDDRDTGAGVKFNDADLIGIPMRLTIGNKLKEGKVELFNRSSGETEEIPADEVSGEVIRRVKS